VKKYGKMFQILTKIFGKTDTKAFKILKNLARNGTKIVKIFLHVSKEEQKKRFLDRINENKN
jgi:polyphosphate kinase 2 (PPK2 family)